MQTEGIKYAGSKRSIIPYLFQAIQGLPVKTVLDGFSGTTRVSQALKAMGYVVYANDIAVYSKAFGNCYLLNKRRRANYIPMIEHLNNLPGKHGWFSEHYGGEPNGGSAVAADGKKRMWQFHNSQKLDAIREEIDNIANDEVEKSTLLTSLMQAMDRVDSSLGHQAAYLKKWASRAYNNVELRVPNFAPDEKEHRVFNQEIFDLIDDVEVDLAYFDPPYGSSNELMPPSRVRYAAYYHIWKTICLNDKPTVTGVANRRADAGDNVSPSVFEEFRKNEKGQYIVISALEKLIDKSKSKYIVLSYNNNGRATFSAILDIVDNFKNRCKVIEIAYRKNVMASMTTTQKWLNNNGKDDEESLKNKEFLFVIDKTAATRCGYN